MSVFPLKFGLCPYTQVYPCYTQQVTEHATKLMQDTILISIYYIISSASPGGISLTPFTWSMKMTLKFRDIWHSTEMGGSMVAEQPTGVSQVWCSGKAGINAEASTLKLGDCRDESQMV